MEQKKDYQKPMMRVIKLQRRSQLLVGSGEYSLPDPQSPQGI